MSDGTDCERPPRVRPAVAADIPRIAEILVFAKRAAYRAIFRDDDGSFNQLRVTDLADAYRADPELLSRALVYDDGIVKGVLTRREDAAHVELCELYAEPCFWGRGVGSALLRALLAEARGRRVTLWVLRENPGARRLYERFGFRPDGRERCVEGTAVWELGYTRDGSIAGAPAER